MGTKLDLSALKNKAQHVKTDKVNSTISGREGDLGQASRSIVSEQQLKKHR